MRGRLQGWYRDEFVRRLAKNAGYLLSGNALAAGLGLVALALTARSLGPEHLGLLALIEAYTRLMDRLIRLEPWQALIKYGAAALEEGRPDRFRSLLKLGLLIDLCGATAAAVVAASVVVVAGPWLGWSDETVWMAGICSLGLVSHLAATPTAVLRLFDRFAVFASVEVVTAALRVALVFVAYLAGAGLWTFLLLAMGLLAARHLALAAVAWREVWRRGYGDFLGSSLAGTGTQFPGIWGFVWSLKATNLTRRSTGDLDVLIVGALLDNTAVGLYHVAKRLGDAARKIGMPIEQAIFPEIARLWARQQIGQLRHILFRLNVLVGGLSSAAVVVVALNVDWVVEITVGAAYQGAGLLVVLQLVATTIALYGLGYRSALLSMGMQIAVLRIVVVAALGFYAALFLAIPYFGVLGACLGHVVLNAVWLVGMISVYARRIKREVGEPARLAGVGG